MKQIIKNYSFNKDTKTVTLTDFTSIEINRLMLVTNVTKNTVIYQFNSTELGGTVSGNVITLASDTSAMSNTDSLQIIYNSGPGDPAYDAPLLDSNSNISATLATALAGEDLSNDVMKVEQRCSYANITTSSLVKTGSGRLFGFIVNSHTNGTLKLWDNTSAATTTILNTITFNAGPNFVMFPVAVEFTTGLYATVSGTIDLTILYR